jgi:hypothetical protein
MNLYQMLRLTVLALLPLLGFAQTVYLTNGSSSQVLTLPITGMGNWATLGPALPGGAFAFAIAVSDTTVYVTDMQTNGHVYQLPITGVGSWATLGPAIPTGKAGFIAISDNTAYVTNLLGASGFGSTVSLVFQLPLTGVGNWSTLGPAVPEGLAGGIALANNSAYVTDIGSLGPEPGRIYTIPLTGVGNWSTLGPALPSGFTMGAIDITTGTLAYVTTNTPSPNGFLFSLVGGVWATVGPTIPMGSAGFLAISDGTAYVTNEASAGQVYQIPLAGGSWSPFGPHITSGNPFGIAIGASSPSPPGPPLISTTGLGQQLFAFSRFAAANAQFAASDVVEDHQGMQRFLRKARRHTNQEETTCNELLTEASEELTSQTSLAPVEEKGPSFKKRCAHWVELFGEYARQKQQMNSPSFKDSLGGIVLAVDLFNYKSTVFGGGIGYTYSYVHEGRGAGHATINQEYAVLYSAFEFRKFYFDPALWGGLMQVANSRHNSTPGFVSTAKSDPHGWMLSPHLEIGYDIDRSGWTLEPFAMFDWPNVWQDPIHERGAGTLDLSQKRHHSSLLRSELGFRFYQSIRRDHGRCIVQEKVSYVNKKPFDMGSVTTSFLAGIPRSLTVDTLSGVQNLGCAEIEFLYDPDNKSHPSISVSYQGEFGASYYSNLAMVSLGKEF